MLFPSEPRPLAIASSDAFLGTLLIVVLHTKYGCTSLGRIFENDIESVVLPDLSEITEQETSVISIH